ncbi:DUF3306 domain-containing protein [Marivita hallyeonensis]|uniref:DUF3306 domain-containing protein n=1 Tax=Marivita hallyeonensis TaxID=996342 RepID=A0A1M5N9I5_9RHOB|nr:DUF3306 domain-containing protein [Marivita hallyeonensis]SHG85859.1 Protein of unknown function [Marivita hallyeonensis]
MSRGSDFWSRRKAQVEAEAAEEARAVEDAEARAAQAELEEKSDAEILDELGLPDPDQLEPGQNISGFMQKAVPERLRQRALRQLWRLNPALANLDGLCDYNGDFTNAATDAPGVATAYRVGKGLMKHIEALEREAAEKAKGIAAENPENPSELAAIGTDSEVDAENAEKTEILQDSADTADASTTIVSDVAEYADGTPLDTVEEEPLRPRRMRFRIESETE